jgi:preprotein translocase subunit SecE
MIKKIKNFPRFLKEVKGELKKVSWSTREELISAAFIVIVASIFLTIYIAGIDFILSNIIRYFLK